MVELPAFHRQNLRQRLAICVNLHGDLFNASYMHFAFYGHSGSRFFRYSLPQSPSSHHHDARRVTHAPVVKPVDILVDCCVSLRGPSKRFPTRHKDFQGAHGNEIGTRMCADHAIWVKIRNTIVEKVYRENFHTEAS